MNKIQKISAYLLIIFNLLLISAPLIIAIQWIFVMAKIVDLPGVINFFGLFERVIKTPEGYINLSLVNWTIFTKILGFSADILGLLPFILSLFVLKLIFKNYQRGDVFSMTNAIHYKKLGWLFFSNALIIEPLSNTLRILAITLSNAPGHRYINIHFGIPSLKALFAGALLIVISLVMFEASKIHDEQKFTI